MLICHTRENFAEHNLSVIELNIYCELTLLAIFRDYESIVRSEIARNVQLKQ